MAHTSGSECASANFFAFCVRRSQRGDKTYKYVQNDNIVNPKKSMQCIIYKENAEILNVKLNIIPIILHKEKI